ncbi:MAG TPA: hypothetical protein PKA02_03255 [Candidatus Saccharibacteria bacterium]|nr:hypothetical protein [Candidatus Saccharibacteria bacterium]
MSMSDKQQLEQLLSSGGERQSGAAEVAAYLGTIRLDLIGAGVHNIAQHMVPRNGAARGFNVAPVAMEEVRIEAAPKVASAVSTAPVARSVEIAAGGTEDRIAAARAQVEDIHGASLEEDEEVTPAEPEAAQIIDFPPLRYEADPAQEMGQAA